MSTETSPTPAEFAAWRMMRERGWGWKNEEADRLLAEVERAAKMRSAIEWHHSQKADDRCWMDDQKLYEAAGLPVPDLRVGDKAAMLRNCERFIHNRCAGGGWQSYAELEAERDRLKAALELCAGSAKVAMEKMTESPCSAMAHIEEGLAAAAAVGVLVSERYSPEAAQLRLQLPRYRAVLAPAGPQP